MNGINKPASEHAQVLFCSLQWNPHSHETMDTAYIPTTVYSLSSKMTYPMLLMLVPKCLLYGGSMA